MSARPKRRLRRTPERTRRRRVALATEHRLKCGYWFIATPDRCEFYDPDGNLLTKIIVYPEDPWHDIVADA